MKQRKQSSISQIPKGNQLQSYLRNNNQDDLSKNMVSYTTPSRNPITNSILNRIQNAMTCHTCKLKKPHSFLILKCNHIICQACIQLSYHQLIDGTYIQTHKNNNKKAIKTRRLVRCLCGVISHLDQSLMMSNQGYIQESLQKNYLQSDINLYQDTKCQTTKENIFLEEGSFEIENYIQRDYQKNKNADKTQNYQKVYQQNYRPRKTVQVVPHQRNIDTLQNYLQEDRRSTHKRSKNHSREITSISQLNKPRSSLGKAINSVQSQKRALSNQSSFRQYNNIKSPKNRKKVAGIIRTLQNQNLDKFKKTNAAISKKGKTRPSKYYVIHTEQGQTIPNVQRQYQFNRSLQKLLKQQEYESNSEMQQSRSILKTYQKQNSIVNTSYNQGSSYMLDLMKQQKENFNPNKNEQSRRIKLTNQNTRYSQALQPLKTTQDFYSQEDIQKTQFFKNPKHVPIQDQLRNEKQAKLSKQIKKQQKLLRQFKRERQPNFAKQIGKQLKLLKMQYIQSRKQLTNDFQRALAHLDCQFENLLQNFNQASTQQLLINDWNTKQNVIASTVKISKQFKRRYKTKIQQKIENILCKLIASMTGQIGQKQDRKKELKSSQSKLIQTANFANYNCRCQKQEKKRQLYNSFEGIKVQKTKNNALSYEKELCRHHKEKVRHSYNKFIDDIHRNNKMCKKGIKRQIRTFMNQFQ